MAARSWDSHRAEARNSQSAEPNITWTNTSTDVTAPRAGKIGMKDKQRETVSSPSLIKQVPAGEMSLYFLAPSPPPGCFKNLLHHLFSGQSKLAHL